MLFDAAPGVEVGYALSRPARYRSEIADGISDWDGDNDSPFERNFEVPVQFIFEHLVHGRQGGSQSQRPTRKQDVLNAWIDGAIVWWCKSFPFFFRYFKRLVTFSTHQE